MKRLLIIPAAGLSLRMESATPKLLIHVNGRPMIDYLFELYAEVIEQFILVLHPSFENEVVSYCAKYPHQIDYIIQRLPTGMLDAILLPHDRVQRYQPTNVWITWCDQIAIHQKTINTLIECSNQCHNFSMILPTMKVLNPYIHFVRNEKNEIINVLQQREGDDMPETGESDMGLFCLSLDAYLNHLDEFSQKVGNSIVTKERNFLPFIPWLYGRGSVKTSPGNNAIECVGINTRSELRKIEKYLNNERKDFIDYNSRV